MRALNKFVTHHSNNLSFLIKTKLKKIQRFGAITTISLSISSEFQSMQMQFI